MLIAAVLQTKGIIASASVGQQNLIPGILHDSSSSSSSSGKVVKWYTHAHEAKRKKKKEEENETKVPTGMEKTKTCRTGPASNERRRCPSGSSERPGMYQSCTHSGSEI